MTVVSGRNVPYGGEGRAQTTFGDAYGALPTIDFTSQQFQMGAMIGVVLGVVAVLLYGRYIA